MPPLAKRKRFLHAVFLATLLSGLVFLSYSFIRFAAYWWFDYEFSTIEAGILIASVPFAVIIYKPIARLLLGVIREITHRRPAGDFRALNEVACLSRTVSDEFELANLVVNTLGETWGFRVVSVLLWNQEEGMYRIASAFGLRPHEWRSLTFRESRPVLELLRTRKILLERERIAKAFSWREANQLRHDFERLHASSVIPMFFEGRLLGTINLLPRAVMRPLTRQELKSFRVFANELAVSFRNAALYGELEKSNRDLAKIQSELLSSAQHSAIAQLAVGIAHEIHNPLTIISGKAQILLLKKDKIAYDQQVEDVLKTIVKQTKRAADITRKLLMFSDTKKSVREPIDFEILVSDTIALLSYQVSLDQIEVIKRFTHPLPKWHGNVSEMREAFLNLFLNAVQAIGQNGSIHVSVRHRTHDGAIEIRVSDSGVGIPEEDLARVFQPFFTTRDSATGLGLFVTQQIVSSYQGSVRAERGTQGGATFIVELPVQQAVKIPEKRRMEHETADRG